MLKHSGKRMTLVVLSKGNVSSLTLTNHNIKYRRKVWQPKGALHVSASSAKKILIMGGTRFIGVFLSRLLVKEGHQVTLFTRGKAPITQQLPGESEKDYVDFSSKVGNMIQAESDPQKRDEYLKRLMELPNQKWVEIIGQARHSVDFLKDEDVIRTVLNILQELIDVEGDGMADMVFRCI
ncbi:uncharacterized protein LOC114311566 [Camellia sinensis]|uniref:uncharacterized protein LOC114311566 n=1 Tax=Camellia sinensis TaxID=4442 RepID=UPI001036C036|nr:uncharacterized protein LOC114311566 [Camellia sinensis]